METQHFFNTNNSPSVIANKKKNKSQEAIILPFFQIHKKLTASEVLAMYPGNVPITSIRRAISNLQYGNKITKTKETKIGLYDANEHFYIISNFEDRQLDLF